MIRSLYKNEMWLLKKGPAPVHVPVETSDWRAEDRFGGIRCPLCHWRPSPSSLWCCDSTRTPEPFFGGCGALWNTFSTRGRCPGCAHQWQWTSCLHCKGWSLHDDWYEREGR